MSNYKAVYHRQTDPERDCPLGVPKAEETYSIKIDFSQIPEHVRDELASSTIDAVNEFLRRPGGREFLDKKIALRKARIESR